MQILVENTHGHTHIRQYTHVLRTALKEETVIQTRRLESQCFAGIGVRLGREKRHGHQVQWGRTWETSHTGICHIQYVYLKLPEAFSILTCQVKLGIIRYD